MRVARDRYLGDEKPSDRAMRFAGQMGHREHLLNYEDHSNDPKGAWLPFGSPNWL